MKKQISPKVAGIVIAVIVIVVIVVVFATMKKATPTQTQSEADRTAVGSPMKMMKGAGSMGKIGESSGGQPSAPSPAGQPSPQ